MRCLLATFSIGFTLFPSAQGFAAQSTKGSRAEVSLKVGSNDDIIPLKKGSTCALITPWTETGDVDVAGLRKLLQFHLESGTDNLCILGTTGEAAVMTMDERETILSTAVDMVKGKIPILVGTGTINPESVKAMTQQAIDLGCDANLVCPPYYVKPPQRCMIKHFLTMADMGLPLIVYNIPGRAVVDVSDESLVICAEHENIVGVKDATGDLARVGSLRKLVGDDFLMYSGEDGSSLEFVELGGDGCISVTANLAPKAMHNIMMAALKGETEKAREVNSHLELLHNRLFLETSPIPAKWAAKQMGLIDSAYCRPPLDELDPKLEAAVTEALRHANLI